MYRIVGMARHHTYNISSALDLFLVETLVWCAFPPSNSIALGSSHIIRFWHLPYDQLIPLEASETVLQGAFAAHPHICTESPSNWRTELGISRGCCRNNLHYILNMPVMAVSGKFAYFLTTCMRRVSPLCVFALSYRTKPYTSRIVPISMCWREGRSKLFIIYFRQEKTEDCIDWKTRDGNWLTIKCSRDVLWVVRGLASSTFLIKQSHHYVGTYG